MRNCLYLLTFGVQTPFFAPYRFHPLGAHAIPPMAIRMLLHLNRLPKSSSTAEQCTALYRINTIACFVYILRGFIGISYREY